VPRQEGVLGILAESLGVFRYTQRPIGFPEYVQRDVSGIASGVGIFLLRLRLNSPAGVAVPVSPYGCRGMS
jgi:hypothetical protein